ncbi:MAG: hypothetical protein IPO27_06225 [Bacteroidetes bacterium]|nr:hypothetical protein [Bacteroidota bacterium]
MMKIIIGVFLVLVCSIYSCKKQGIETFDCAGTVATYNGTVKAILDSKCATSGCHNATSNAAGINLSSYSSAKSVAGQDKFLGSIQHKSGFSKMPQDASKLDDATIKTLSCWVQNGTPEN